MVWQIVHKIDFETALKVTLLERSPFLEAQGAAGVFKKFMKENMPKDDKSMDMMFESITLAENLTSPRVIKTHLPIEMLPPKVVRIMCETISIIKTQPFISVA